MYVICLALPSVEFTVWVRISVGDRVRVWVMDRYMYRAGILKLQTFLCQKVQNYSMDSHTIDTANLMWFTSILCSLICIGL